MNGLRKLKLIEIISVILFTVPTIFSQPSGGLYGPIDQIYNLPQNVRKIFYVAPDGNYDSSGENIKNPTTIESAIENVSTGDVIILRGGIYRTGNLFLNQGITLQPYQDEKPVFKGTKVATSWTNIGNGLWVTKWDELFPSKPDSWWRRYTEGKRTPLHRFNNDMVFIDGKFLQSAGWQGEVDTTSYYIDYDNHEVYIGTDPLNKLIEITSFNSAIIRTTKDIHNKTSDHKGFIARGITFTQYAYRAIEIEGKDPEGLDPEANHGKDVIGTVLDNCSITFCSRVAAYLRGDSLIIRHCKISDTSTEGIYILSSSDVLLEGNIFTRNNIENITGYYPAAVKIFNQCYRVTCKDNKIIDLPNSNGVWYDVGNVDGHFINNWVENVGDINSEFSVKQPWPSNNGFFFEISKGAICAGNIFINCDHGIWALNSSNVQVYQNTFINSTACIARNARSAAGDHFGWHPSTGPDVNKRDGHIFVNNLLVGDINFRRPLLYIWQPDTLCGMVKTNQLKKLDYNVYVHRSEIDNDPLILCSTFNNDNCKTISLKSLIELRKLYPEFSINSKFFDNYSGNIFISEYLKDFRLVKVFPGIKIASSLPLEIKKLLGISKIYPGAFPSDD